MAMMWITNGVNGLHALGDIPSLLDDGDPRPAREQFDENYNFGGGWVPLADAKVDARTGVMTYPDDPPYLPMAAANLRDERIIVYTHGIVAIVQPDGSAEVSRID